MRKLTACIVYLIAVAFMAVPLPAQSSQAQKILDDMIAALGGQAFLDVKDIHTTGRFFQFKRGELAGGDNFSDPARAMAAVCAGWQPIA